MFAFFRGIGDGIRGFGLILTSGSKRFIIVPLIVNILLFYTAITLLVDQLDLWIQQLLPSWLGWLEWIVWPLFAVAILLAIFYSFTLLANLIASPFNSLLSSRIEASLTGRAPVDITTGKLAGLIARTVMSELKKIVYSIKWMIPLLILTLIPVINIVAPFAWMLFAAWFFALEYTDYPLANRGLLFDEVKRFNRLNRMRALGLGCVIFILTSIPVLNFVAMPVAVAAATRLCVEVRGQGTPSGEAA